MYHCFAKKKKKKKKTKQLHTFYIFTRLVIWHIIFLKKNMILCSNNSQFPFTFRVRL